MAGAGDGGRFRFDGLLLCLGPDGALQGDLAVLGDDLHVVRVGRQPLVAHQRAPNLLRCLSICDGVLLLIGGHGPRLAVAHIHFAVVRLGRLRRNNTDTPE